MQKYVQIYEVFKIFLLTEEQMLQTNLLDESPNDETSHEKAILHDVNISFAITNMADMTQVQNKDKPNVVQQNRKVQYKQLNLTKGSNIRLLKTR